MPNATEPISRVLAEAGLPQPWRTLAQERPKRDQVVEARPYGMTGVLRAKLDTVRGAWEPVNPVLKAVLTTDGDEWRPLPPEATAPAAPPPSRQDVLERAERRERFVRSLVTGMGAVREESQVGISVAVVSFADQLLWALDRRRDAELEEAGS